MIRDSSRTGAVLFATLLAVPAAAMIWRLTQGEWAGELLHGSGEMAARLLILAMAITPLQVLAPRARWVRWLRRHRRIIGVAACGYAVLHTGLYLADVQTLRNVLLEFSAPGIWTGWAALALMLVLGATSNDRSMRWLGQMWQRLHRVVYAAALLTLLHWVLIHDNVVAALMHFLPLALLEIYRVQVRFLRKDPVSPDART